MRARFVLTGDLVILGSFLFSVRLYARYIIESPLPTLFIRYFFMDGLSAAYLDGTKDVHAKLSERNFTSSKITSLLDVSHDKISRPLPNTFDNCVSWYYLHHAQTLWKNMEGWYRKKVQTGIGRKEWYLLNTGKIQQIIFYYIKIAKYCAKEFKSNNE